MHRNLQREFVEHGLDDLTAALASLYAHVYGVPADRVRAAAAHRAEAMKISDAWVEAGSDATSPAIAAERDELVKVTPPPRGRALSAPSRCRDVTDSDGNATVRE